MMKRLIPIFALISACTAGEIEDPWLEVGDVGDDTALPGADEGADVTFAGDLKAGDTARVCNTSAGLRQRSGPGTGYGVLRVMPEGTTVKILQVSGTWLKNDWGTRIGWSSGKYLCKVSGGGGGDCTAGPGTSNDGPWSCDDLTGSTTNPTGRYYTTSFGCWVDEDGVAHSDPGDNCIPACSLASIGCSGLTGPECERQLNWYTADADRFGCGTLLKVTNPDNGRSAVLKVIDRGPNCSIENNVDYWVLDMSYRASYFLFGGPTSATEKADVQIQVMPAGTPLGPYSGGDTCTPPETEPEPEPDPTPPEPEASFDAPTTRAGAIAISKAAVGFSYWWGGGRFAAGAPFGACYGSCPSCSHEGNYGADCSGFLGKVWRLPESLPMEQNLHPFSTDSFVNGSTHWERVSRGSVTAADALGYRSGGKGHILLFESGDPWGQMWSYEARGCSYGVVHNLRSVGSAYVGIRRDGY